MRAVRIVPAVLVFAVSFGAIHANIMSRVWPQKSIAAAEYGPRSSSARVLLAGTASDFRNAVIRLVADSLIADSVFLKTTSFKALAAEKVADWSAIVIVNTCMAWDIENDARRFIAANPAYRGFILCTVSGDPHACCSSTKLPAGLLDAISTASAKEKTAPVASQIVAAVRTALRDDTAAQAPRPCPEKSDAATGATYKKR